MKTLILLSITSYLMFAADSLAADGWQPLFDGKSIDGWEVKGGKATYKVEDGAIVGTTTEGSPNTFLCRGPFGDFELELDALCDKELNSGIQIRSHVYEKDTPQASKPDRIRRAGEVFGYQCEIAPAAGGVAGNFWDEARHTKWHDDFANKPAARAAFKDNEWNHYRIVAQGDHIRSWVNGVPCADFHDKTDATGFIGLQVHGIKPSTGPYRVRWKNVRIRELEPDEKVATAVEPNMRFRSLDRNQDGKLTKDELDRPGFDKIDANKDGAITPEEQSEFSRRRASRNRTKGEKPPVPPTVKAELDVPYAATDNPRQRLDLYLPAKPTSDKPLPVVVYIHGGGWHKGDKSGGYRKLGTLVERGGYAGVSVGYRLSHEAIWPAQIHDCKAAIRWLRANAVKYNLDPDRIGLVGTSAGGHLVAMLGTSGDVSALEGSLGEHTKLSSRVSCVVDFFGPSDLLSLGGFHNTPQAPGADLLGGAIPEKKEAAREASPITYVSKDDPPFLMIHGTNDAIVPYQQSESLKAALEKERVSALLVPVTRGGHGVSGDEATARMKQFFDKHLLGKDVTVNVEPITSIK